MKNMLLLTAVSLFMTIGTILGFHEAPMAQITLPEVQITAQKTLPTLPEIHLPTVTIRAAKSKVATMILPEVVIKAKFRKV